MLFNKKKAFVFLLLLFSDKALLLTLSDIGSNSLKNKDFPAIKLLNNAL